MIFAVYLQLNQLQVVSWKQLFQALAGFEPMSSAMSVQML